MKKLSIFQPLAVISGQASIHERVYSSDKVNKIETLLTTRQIIKVDKNHLKSGIDLNLVNNMFGEKINLKNFVSRNKLANKLRHPT